MLSARYAAVSGHGCGNIAVQKTICRTNHLQRCRNRRNRKRHSKRQIHNIVGVGKIVLCRSPRQTHTIELGNCTKIEWEADAFRRCKTTIECKVINTRLTDGKAWAVGCMTDGCAIGQRIPVKQQRRLSGTGLRRCGVGRQ